MVTICPSFTASLTILPVMSELRSTLVCGRTWPLAVTDATRSRACTASMRTSTALLPLFAAVSPPIAARTRITPPNTDIFTRLLMIGFSVGRY